jgi:hypothetical protein
MFRKIIFTLGTSIAFSMAPASAEQPRLVLSYYSIADRVRKMNPDLVAARFRVEEAKGRLSQSGLLANPEFIFQATDNQR